MITREEQEQIVKSAIVALISAHRAEFDHLIAEGKRKKEK